MSAVVQQRFSVKLSGRGACQLCTNDVLAHLPSLPRTGVLHLFCLTPSVSLCLNENADPTVRRDLEAAARRLSGGDAASAAALFGSSSLSLPLRGARPALGTWQGVYVCAWAPGVREAELVATARACPDPRPMHFDPPRRAAHSVPLSLAGGRPAGLAHASVKHTSASLAVAVPAGRAGGSRDVEEALSEVVPERWNDEIFEHTYEGPDDMPAHAKCALVGATITVPVALDGSLCLPPSHDVVLVEHRDTGGWGGGGREYIVTEERSAVARVEHTVAGVPAGTWADAGSTVLRELAAAASGVRAGVAHVFALSAGVAVAVAGSADAASLASAASHVRGLESVVFGLGASIPVTAGSLVTSADQTLFVGNFSGGSADIRLLLTVVGDKK